MSACPCPRCRQWMRKDLSLGQAWRCYNEKCLDGQRNLRVRGFISRVERELIDTLERDSMSERDKKQAVLNFIEEARSAGAI